MSLQQGYALLLAERGLQAGVYIHFNLKSPKTATSPPTFLSRKDLDQTWHLPSIFHSLNQNHCHVMSFLIYLLIGAHEVINRSPVRFFI